MTDLNTHNDASYYEFVVLAVKTLLQKAREQKEWSLSIVGEDSLLAAVSEHLEQELIQVLMNPKDYIKDAANDSWIGKFEDYKMDEE